MAAEETQLKCRQDKLKDITGRVGVSSCLVMSKAGLLVYRPAEQKHSRTRNAQRGLFLMPHGTVIGSSL
jgi:hypothetical protein